jgi:hypothetical protein
MLISKALPLFAAVLVIGTAGGKLICLESGPDAANRQSIRGNREYDILLNTNPTVLCRPGVAYQPDSVLSVIDYQPNGARYNILTPDSPYGSWCTSVRNPRPSGRGGGQGSPPFSSSRLGCHGLFRPPLRHGSTTYLRIPCKFYNQRLGIVPN